MERAYFDYELLFDDDSTTDTGYYRTSPLVQQDFQIALSRQVDVLASTGVSLFIASVMAYGRDEDGYQRMCCVVI